MKLTKKQEQRFIGFADKLIDADTGEAYLSTKYNGHFLVKQHLAKELDIQRKEFIAELDKITEILK